MIESENPPQIQTEAAVEPATGLKPASETPADRAQQEVEIKFATDAAGLAAARASPLLRVDKPSPARKLVSIYFDTPDWALKKRKMALRVRRAGRAAPVMTLKWPLLAPGDVFARGEVEVRAPNMEPDISPVRRRHGREPARNHRRGAAGGEIRDPGQAGHAADRAWIGAHRSGRGRGRHPCRRARIAVGRSRTGAEIRPRPGFLRFRRPSRRKSSPATRQCQQGGARRAFLRGNRAQAGQGPSPPIFPPTPISTRPRRGSSSGQSNIFWSIGRRCAPATIPNPSTSCVSPCAACAPRSAC